MSVLAPRGADPSARNLVAARALRAAVDGYVAVLLPAYLLGLGIDVWSVGVLMITTGVGFATLSAFWPRWWWPSSAR
jgi:hypothetical protein